MSPPPLPPAAWADSLSFVVCSPLAAPDGDLQHQPRLSLESRARTHDGNFAISLVILRESFACVFTISRKSVPSLEELGLSYLGHLLGDLPRMLGVG